MAQRSFLGTKFYRYIEDDKIEIIRVYKSNEVDVSVYDTSNEDNKFKLSLKELEDKYVRLNPHAIINFCIAKVGNNLDDVIVAMHKYSDITSNEPTPYAVCRQNITDVFANQIKISDKMYVGCCMSLYTCPQDVDYRMMIACNGITKSVSVYSYLDDSLDDILRFVKLKDYNRALESLFEDHIKYEASKNPVINSLKNRILNQDHYDGYCKTLKLLLEENNFMYDFYQAFNIIPIDKEVIIDKETSTTTADVIDIIENIYNINITSSLCIKYGYDIDLDNIDNDHVLILDSTDNLYVLAYTASGTKSIDLTKTESDENIELLANSTIGNNESVKASYNHIRLNKNKYN